MTTSANSLFLIIVVPLLSHNKSILRPLIVRETGIHVLIRGTREVHLRCYGVVARRLQVAVGGATVGSESAGSLSGESSAPFCRRGTLYGRCVGGLASYVLVGVADHYVDLGAEQEAHGHRCADAHAHTERSNLNL